MKILTVEGYSDDTFMCTGPGIDIDHDNAASGEPVVFRIQSGADAMLVIGQYAAAPSGGWQIAVAPIDNETGDDQPIPDWPMAIGRSQRPYSPALFITAPDDVSVVMIGDDA